MIQSWEVSAITFWLIKFFFASEDTEWLAWVFGAIFNFTFIQIWILLACITSWLCWIIRAGTFILINFYFTWNDTFILSWIFYASFHSWWNVFNQFWVIAYVFWIFLSFVSNSDFTLPSSLDFEHSSLWYSTLSIIGGGWLEHYKYIPIWWEEIFLRKLCISVDSYWWCTSFILVSLR